MELGECRFGDKSTSGNRPYELLRDEGEGIVFENCIGSEERWVLSFIVSGPPLYTEMLSPDEHGNPGDDDREL